MRVPASDTLRHMMITHGAINGSGHAMLFASMHWIEERVVVAAFFTALLILYTQRNCFQRNILLCTIILALKFFVSVGGLPHPEYYESKVMCSTH